MLFIEKPGILWWRLIYSYYFRNDCEERILVNYVEVVKIEQKIIHLCIVREAADLSVRR